MKNINQIIQVALSAFCIAATIGISHAQDASFKVPEYEKFTLPNGLTVYLMEQHEVPTINVSAIVPAGAIYDGEQSGLASLTAAGLQHGTKSFTKSQIEEELDFIGARMNTYASKEYAGISSKFASKDQDKVMPILVDVLTRPVFDEEEFVKEQKRVLSGLERAKESPRSVINAYWDKFLFDDHVYGNAVSGSPLTVGAFKAEDLRSFYKANYSPTGSAIAMVGAFDTEQMKQKISDLFKHWENNGEQKPNVAAHPVPEVASNRVLLVNKEDARETTFLIGGMGVQRDNPDYVAIQVVNTVFGGRFTSWLNDELRVNSGLTYGANSNFNPLKNSGTFAISTFTANNTTEETIDLALQVLDRLHTQGIDDETLTSAKNYVKGQFPPKYETSGQLAGLLTQMFWYDFDESYINNFQSNVEGLTTGKAKDIVKQYFPKENLQFLLIGKADEIRPIAAKLGDVTEKDIKSDGF